MSSYEQVGNLIVNPEDTEVQILSYQFPEVREQLSKLSLPQSFNMRTQTPHEAQDKLLTGGYDFNPSLELPSDSHGLVNFEAIHVPVVKRITERNEVQLPGLSSFENQYATHGSSDSIFRLMSEWSRKKTNPMTEMASINGDYDGYTWSANVLSIDTHTVASLEEAGEPVKGRVWFVSNPSATDGNWHDNDVWQKFLNDGHEVVVDGAYVGLTADEHPLDVSAPNIKAVLTSPSKIFGVFKQRFTGVTYTREMALSLVDTMWFKSLPALMGTLMLYETFEPHELARKYKDRQLIICQALGELVGKDIKPSDTILLAHTDEALAPEYSLNLSTEDRYCFRLSTLFEKLELHNLI